jgi:Ca2+-binding RTX toxin-like protein
LSGANIGIEDLVLTGTGAIDGNGNQSNNLILGNDNNNVLVGREGSDTLTGGAGNDTLHGNVTSNGSDGPLNKDILNGGAGGDLYRIADGDTVIESLAGTAGGADTVHYFGSIGYTLGANVENLAIMGGAFATGNALDNHITGSAGGDRLSGMAGNDTIVGFGGNDTIDGGAGADSMVGGTGFEIFIVDDIGDVVDDRLGGVSSVHSSISFDLTENGTTTFGLLMNLVLTGSKAISGTGNALPNNITGNGAANILDGGSGRDALNGGAGNDKLFGGAGAFFDALDGGAGADTMEGGDENDFYFVDNANDIVVETNGDAAQLDSVFASINNYALPDNVEVLRLEGGAGVGSGNNLANLMFGNLSRANKLFGLGGDDEMYGQDGADVLDGGAGDDTMDGGNGNDTYYVDSDRDVANDRIGSGVDTVIATADYLLAAGNNIERLTLAAGAGDIDGTGNELANLITGNEGNNKLGGGAGADTIVGGVGRDTLLGGDSNDKLDGGVDDDRLSGGAGDDTLTGGAGFDIFFHNAVTDGHDLITGFDGNASGGQDFLDLDALFDSLGIATADRADRVLFTDRGSSVEVRIDTDLNGTPDAHVATLVTPDVITVGVDIVLGTG